MGSVDRDAPRDGDAKHLRHQHSASLDPSRLLVPMWDSSDPDRAPPPLPLNPQSPAGHTSRAGTSSAIQSAHALLSERARESNALVPALAKRITGNDGSPERGGGSGKGSAHRRMQSMQTGSVRDLSLMIEGSQSPSPSPTRSPERGFRSDTPSTLSSRDSISDFGVREQDSRESTPVPGPSLTPIVRPNVRRPAPQSILGENTPPQSSTMLALQSMSSQSSLREAEPALNNITNGAMPGIKQLHSLDSVAQQILSLTNIATSLQKEMGQLSRRSRDNATDLLSLKEVTKTRDEDIRKGLRDLVGSIGEGSERLSFSGAGLYLDNKPHNDSPSNRRSIQLPRIPSLKSFSDSLDGGSTPLLSAEDSSAATGLLEAIMKDMGTKDGQSSLLRRLKELSTQISGLATASKVDDLARYVRANASATAANAVVPTVSGSNRDISTMGLDLTNSQAVGGPMTQRVEQLLHNEGRRSSAPLVRASDMVNEDLKKIIYSVKDSVSQGGGLTAEVKALVRELRGEVLGMGRELGKRLEQVNRSASSEEQGPGRDEVSRVIDQGLEQMKDQLSHVLREHRRTSAQSASSQKSLVDYQEVYNAMRAAFRDHEASRGDAPDLNREDVIEAVRDAWETYKPEIEVQHLGLEREEVLDCLKQGLQEYTSRDLHEERSAGATREEVFKAVVEGLKHFVPPQVDSPAALSRDEIIEAVRDCLEEFEFPVAASAVGGEMSKADMVHAVREGLNGLDMPRDGALVSNADNSEIHERLQDILDCMRMEFKAVSDEAKDNVAANGRDTEQVLDATKDGLENLRIAIEQYVDRASGAASQDEFMDGLVRTMNEFKDELGDLVSQATDASREQLRQELESLREVVNSSMVPSGAQSAVGNNQEVLEALHNGVHGLRQDILRPKPELAEILDALNDGLSELRAGINKPVDLTANDEILDTLKAGLASLKSEIESIRDSSNDQAVAAFAVGNSDKAVVPADSTDVLKQDDIKNLETMILQLRIKVEAMGPEIEATDVHKEDFSRLEDMLRNVQRGVDEMKSREPPETARNASTASEDAATREDIQAIENILRNTKAGLEDLMDGEQAVRKDHIDALETLLLETRQSMSAFGEQMEAMSRKEDISSLEALMAQLSASLDEVKDRATADEEDPEKATKTDIEAVETVVLEIKTALDGFTGTDFASISNKEDMAKIENILKEARDNLGEHVEATTKAFDDRQAEIVGVGERVSEVKTFLEEFSETMKTKLEDGSGGVEVVGKLLETLGEKMEKNENVGEDLKEMFETMKTEFEDSKNVIAGAKLESDEKLQQATESIGTKIDDKITELMAKYDEFQSTFEEQNKTGEARGIETEAAVVGTKAVADELKLLIDTLGSTVTDSLEKMEEASKTVFTKVEDISSRAEESHNDHKAEHHLTREQVHQAITTLEGMHGDVKEYQPQILQAVKDVLILVGEHFEHSKTSTSDIQDRIVESKPTDQHMLPPPEKYDDSEVKQKLSDLVDHRYDDSEIREKLDRLMEQKTPDPSFHEKLDKLVAHSGNAEQAFAQLAAIDEVHQSVLKTAGEISAFLTTQQQRIADDHDDREKTLQDASIALERRLAERDQLEASILSLKDEEDRVRGSVTSLKTEQESLIRQKTRLTGDVSSLETALRLRKEELADMEHRAERLERRIVEGVMDHSRVLLMSKGTKGQDAMNRKRVKKPAANESEVARSSPRPAVNMALATKRNLASPAQSGSARRIVSLSQINSNAASGGMMRSQSVRSPTAASKALRKRSWGGDLAKGFGEADKENLGVRETVEELDEPETPASEQALVRHGEDLIVEGDHTSLVDETDGDDQSDTGTLRRTSYGTTVLSQSTDAYTESEAGGSSMYDDSEVGRSTLGMSDVSGENGVVVYEE